MLSLFEFIDYREFIKKRFQEMPKKGYGQAHKLSVFLGVHTTLVSQILKGIKTFTLEQASEVCSFFGFSELESDYFLLLVQLDRAGSELLRTNLKRQVETSRKKSLELVQRLKPAQKLSEEMRAIFYSDWTYSAVRQLSALEGIHNLDSISDYFGISKKQTKSIIDMLLKAELIKEEKGNIRIGPSTTHLEVGSPWVRVHHLNWRQKAIESMKDDDVAKLHYTSPLTISKHDAVRIREMIIQFLEEVDKVIDPSPSEELRCLNIDWFKFGK